MAEELPIPVEKIKKEKVSPPCSPVRTVEAKLDEIIPSLFRPETETETPGETEPVDKKKDTGPVKTSDEILLELFQVFNSAPPETEKERKDRKKHKKHKKKTKKKKKDSKSDLSDISDSEDDSEKRSSRDKVKVKKEKLPEEEEARRAARKLKKEKRSRSRDRSPSHRKSDRVDIKVEKDVRHDKDTRPERDGRHDKDSRLDKDRNGRHEKDGRHDKDPRAEKDTRIERDYRRGKDSRSEKETRTGRESDKSGDPKKSNKIVIKDLKNSLVISEADSSSSRRKRKASSSISLSDEETYERERHTRPERSRRPSPGRMDEFRSSYRESRRSRHPDDKPTGDMRERIDKKKLLEIARKNAMHMLKNGQLPGAATMRELEKARYGGKSINELTDFCKKLSNGEIPSDLSSVSSGDSDHDREGNSKAFHHPFVLKDRGPIVMNIRNSVPMPTRPVDVTNAILQAFPVSSGQQHRQSEMEWVPVDPNKTTEATPAVPTSTMTAAKPVKKPETCTTVALIEPSSSASATNPAITPSNNNVTHQNSGPQMSHPPAFVTYPPLRNYNAPPVEPLQPPPQPPPMLQQTTGGVFPPPAPAPNMDVSSIISQRLNAMRKLQENPNDNAAMTLMQNSQKEMSSWAASKFTPGKFLGSTGANILSVKQLQAGGNQAWARKDAFTSSAPLSGGKGMLLLQKMGWNPGEALGKDKTGSLEPLLLDVKLDRKGLIAEEEGPQRKKRPMGGVPGGSRNMKMSQEFMESKHPVSLLGELASKRKWGAPMYEVVHESGPHHHKSFIYQVIMNGMAYTPALPCTTKKEAKKVAAQVCLEQLGVLPTLPMGN